MMSSWWFLWMAAMFVFLVPPVGYGWAYRGWGPPFPRYVQRRRGAQAATAGSTAKFDHHAWGWGGDLLWMLFLAWGICAVWALSAR